jgi:hypothetical protein
VLGCVAQDADARVAFLAEQPAYRSGLVAVVDAPRVAELAVFVQRVSKGSTAAFDGAPSILASEHRFDCFERNAVGTPDGAVEDVARGLTRFPASVHLALLFWCLLGRPFLDAYAFACTALAVATVVAAVESEVLDRLRLLALAAGFESFEEDAFRALFVDALTTCWHGRRAR